MFGPRCRALAATGYRWRVRDQFSLTPSAPRPPHYRERVSISANDDPRGTSAGDRRRAELRDYLRSRRERLTPAEVGLPEAGRRRTPGLRREEVAVLAGVTIRLHTPYSFTWQKANPVG